MRILSIDTSCDETSVAVTDDDRIIVNSVASQIELHKKWGGVVPGIAKRMHQENIDPVLQATLKRAKVTMREIDAIAVTYGPGLAIALEVGVNKAKELSLQFGIPLIGINHMEGHIYSNFARNSHGNPARNYKFPLFAILISGGHTELVLMLDHGRYEIVGKTLDDAVGEAFDKVARMLELGYPGGPMVENLAKIGNAKRFPLPVPMIKNPGSDMSYSGLKTAALYFINRELKPLQGTIPSIQYKQMICDVAASFQYSAVESLLLKAEYALKKLALDHDIKDIVVGGGVAANLYLRGQIRRKFAKKFEIHFPYDKKLLGDNAGMIGVAGYFNALRSNFVEPALLERDPILSL